MRLEQSCFVTFSHFNSTKSIWVCKVGDVKCEETFSFGGEGSAKTPLALCFALLKYKN
jgi:hypothetical protein